MTPCGAGVCMVWGGGRAERLQRGQIHRNPRHEAPPCPAAVGEGSPACESRSCTSGGVLCCRRAGNVACLGALQSGGTELSGVLWPRAGMWAQWCLGILQEKSWEHLLVTANDASALPGGLGLVGPQSDPWPGWRAPSGSPKTHLLGLFAPNGCHLRGVLDWNFSGMRTYKAYESPRRSPEQYWGADRLFILAARIWGGFPSLPVVQLPALGGGHAHQPFIEACLSLGTCPAEEVMGRDD